MYKSILPLTVLALVASAWQAQDEEPSQQLKEEKLSLEFTASAGEAVMVVEAEAESALEQVEVRDPSGAPIFHMRSRGTWDHTMSEFRVETGETDLATLRQTYAEGVYQFRARTVDGTLLLGSATLSHELPRRPVVIYPKDGTLDVATNDLTVQWQVDTAASGYRVSLEQNENDGLTVELPAGTGSFQVPDRYLTSGTETQLEIVAVGPNGNSTQVEIVFTTR